MLVDNAVIMAAGTSSRFAPLSYEKPKALIDVNGEVLIERQIRQLREAGIKDIYIVTGYLAEQFKYLINKLDVKFIYNEDYLIRNNNASIWAARHIIKNTYICSADNYFSINPFEKYVDNSYYAALYSNDTTNEWCIKEDDYGNICSVSVGGSNAWYMLGHTFWSEEFSRTFLNILEAEYCLPETADKLWEEIFINHLDILKMKVKRYKHSDIYEFDTLDELRNFDMSYRDNSRSKIIQSIANSLHVSESDVIKIMAVKGEDASAIGFEFTVNDKRYVYSYSDRQFKRL